MFWGLEFDGWVALLTGALTVATFILGYFTFRLWQATSTAVSDSQKSIDIAERALASNTASAQTQLRPYVFMDVRDFTWHYAADPMVPVSRRVAVTWKNMGQTPAHNLVVSLCAKGFSGDIPPGYDYPDLIAPTASGSLGPGGTMLSNYEFPIEEFGTLASPQSVYYWGWVEYDGFPGTPRHRTEVSARILIAGTPNDPNARLWDRFNPAFQGADENCTRPPIG